MNRDDKMPVNDWLKLKPTYEQMGSEKSNKR